MNRVVCSVLLAGLVSCAPVLNTVQREKAVFTLSETALNLKNAGDDAIEHPAFLIEGTSDLELSTPCQKRSSGRWDCILPDIPVQGELTITPRSGEVNWASVSFYRDSIGARPIYLEAR